MSDLPDMDGPSLLDGDMFLPEVMHDLLALGLPLRIYGEAFHGDPERKECEVANLLSAMIDAAVWGAENPEWVIQFQQARGAKIEAEEADYDFGDEGEE